MYVTKQGECWDEIAKNVYGSEKYIGFPLLDTIIFSAGQELNTPELPQDETDLPAWRRRK